ncbi:MAG: amino acid ABC transporter substrate-binding protein [Woeseiaceae bacterium]|nr:amino acid ABC transporter substrate-binding protein [Woeseiaceae bacterium]
MSHRACSVPLYLAAIFLLTGLSAAAEAAEGTLDKVGRTGEFVIGYRADASPLSYENADGMPSGYSVDICRRIAAAVNAYFPDKSIETKFKRIPADQRISAVVNGEIDIECGSTTITLTRKEQVDFSLPTFVTGASVMTLAAAGIQGISGLAGKKIGVAKGTTTVEELQAYLDDQLIDAEVVIVEDRDVGKRMLDRGEIDALASDQIVLIGQIIESIEPRRYALDNEIFSYEPYGLVLRRNDADFRLVVNRSIAKLYRSGAHADIFYKWIGRIGIDVPPILAAMYQLNAIPE